MTIHRIEFEIPGEPIPKQRARANYQQRRIYTPAETEKFEQRVGLAGTAARLDYHARTGKVWPTHARAYMLFAGIYIQERKPDGDNVFKSIADGLQKVLWANDDAVGGAFPPPRVDRRPRVEVVAIALELDPSDQPLSGADDLVLMAARKVVGATTEDRKRVAIHELRALVREVP